MDSVASEKGNDFFCSGYLGMELLPGWGRRVFLVFVHEPIIFQLSSSLLHSSLFLNNA